MNETSNNRERIRLYKEYRLIERHEAEISGTWKGAHLLFFFLAFVFGSFCTFCFHVLMYLFDEKCVLFPKLQLVRDIRHSFLYEFIPNARMEGRHYIQADGLNRMLPPLPVDFVTTHWIDKSTCYLPTYVPLVSGIFGLVWTTMFLMFSSGSRTLGLQCSWRLLPPVFIFSLAMGGLCIYTTTITTAGLKDLCKKLSEITGSSSCTYTINVVTLAFERRIRGVYQAIQLTIISAWLHTLCWVLAAVVALARVVFVVDFRLVCVSADLVGNIEKMLERHEKHIRTVSPENNTEDMATLTRHEDSDDSMKVRFTNPTFGQMEESEHAIRKISMNWDNDTPVSNAIYRKLLKSNYSNSVPEQHRFIAEMVFDLFDGIIDLTKTSSISSYVDQNFIAVDYRPSGLERTASQNAEFAEELTYALTHISSKTKNDTGEEDSARNVTPIYEIRYPRTKTNVRSNLKEDNQLHSEKSAKVQIVSPPASKLQKDSNEIMKPYAENETSESPSNQNRKAKYKSKLKRPKASFYQEDPLPGTSRQAQKPSVSQTVKNYISESKTSVLNEESPKAPSDKTEDREKVRFKNKRRKHHSSSTRQAEKASSESQSFSDIDSGKTNNNVDKETQTHTKEKKD